MSSVGRQSLPGGAAMVGEAGSNLLSPAGDPTSVPPPDTLVWISTAKNGISYHAIAPDGRKTECGRYIGRIGLSPTPHHGHVLALAEVVDRFGSKPCRQCNGDVERVKPTVRPNKDTPWV